MGYFNDMSTQEKITTGTSVFLGCLFTVLSCSDDDSFIGRRGILTYIGKGHYPYELKFSDDPDDIYSFEWDEIKLIHGR